MNTPALFANPELDPKNRGPVFDGALPSSDLVSGLNPMDGRVFIGSFSANGRAGNSRITLGNGQVFINGTHASNTARISSPNSNTLRVELIGIQTSDFSIADVDSILFRGRKGNDVLTNSTNVPLTAYGNEGNDRITGGSAADLIYGGQGNDVLTGGNGNDRILGEVGNDTIRGGDGNDNLSGANGNDKLYGEDGNDFVTGDAGNDYVDGGDGNDVSHGWVGNDRVLGGSGDDYVIGHDGEDILNGGSGEDWIYGGEQNDSLEGGNGDDRLFGGNGRDTLRGGAGIDTVLGGNDRDTIYGGNNDQLNGNAGQDHILYFSGDKVTNDKSDLKLRFTNKGNAWNLAEMQTIERGLQLIHDATGNNALVTDHVVGKVLTLEKNKTLQGGAAAINVMTIKTRNGVTTYDRVIKFADWDEKNGPIDDTRVLAFVHELAHNFDHDFELAANPHVSQANYTAFTNLSGWRKQQTNSNYVRSLDGQWWYHKNAQFYRSYSKINPSEDWATVWELKFNKDADLPSSSSNLGRKLASVNAFFDRLS